MENDFVLLESVFCFALTLFSVFNY